MRAIDRSALLYQGRAAETIERQSERATESRAPKNAFADNARFIRSLIENPRLVGAVSPSGPVLAKTMASHVDISGDAPIVELGPGTGPVTQALLERGVAPERLILVEYETKFCDLLRKRFPGVNVVQGDAYGLKKTLAGKIEGPIASIVSSLPLLNQPEADRLRLFDEAFEMIAPGACSSNSPIACGSRPCR